MQQPAEIPVDTMDEQNQVLYEAMPSHFETGECGLLDVSRSGPDEYHVSLIRVQRRRGDSGEYEVAGGA